MYFMEGWNHPLIKLPYFIYASIVFGLTACFPLETHLNQEQYEIFANSYYDFKNKIYEKMTFNVVIFFIMFTVGEYLLINDSLFYEFYQVNWKNQFSFLSLFTELV